MTCGREARPGQLKDCALLPSALPHPGPGMSVVTMATTTHETTERRRPEYESIQKSQMSPVALMVLKVALCCRVDNPFAPSSFITSCRIFSHSGEPQR